jgi:NADH dehydrogenase
VAAGRQRENVTINAIGPETFTYRELLRTIGRIIGRPRPLLPLPPLAAYLGATAVGWLVHDKVVTRDEIRGLMANLLYVDAPPAGTTKLTDWAKQNADQLGRRYASELARRDRAR